MPLNYDLKTWQTVALTHNHDSWIRTEVGSSPKIVNRSYVSKRDLKQGVSNPNRYAFFLANGYLPVQSYVRMVDTLTPVMWGRSQCNISAPYTPAVANFSVSDHRTLLHADLNNSIHLPTTDPLFVSLRAKAIASANSNTIEHNAGIAESLTELGKTRRMFLDTARTIVTTMRHVRKGRFTDAAKALGMNHVPDRVSRKRNPASNWLEYRYGWLPLLGSVNETLAATYDLYNRSRFIRHSRGKAEGAAPFWEASTNYNTNGQDYPLSSQYVLGEYAGGGPTHRGVNWHVYRNLRRSLRVDVGYIYRIDNPNLVYTSQLGLTNPLSVAWELVPLSFVADWFANVGDVLEQLGTFTGKTFLTGYITYKESLYMNIKGKLSFYNPPVGFTNSLWQNCELVRSSTRIERQVLTTPPTFGLQLNVELNQKRVVDAVSLLYQMFR